MGLPSFTTLSALILASEAKQVLQGAGVPREPDVEAVEAIWDFVTP